MKASSCPRDAPRTDREANAQRRLRLGAERPRPSHVFSLPPPLPLLPMLTQLSQPENIHPRPPPLHRPLLPPHAPPLPRRVRCGRYGARPTLVLQFSYSVTPLHADVRIASPLNWVGILLCLLGVFYLGECLTGENGPVGRGTGSGRRRPCGLVRHSGGRPCAADPRPPHMR